MCKNDEFNVKEMVLTWILTFPDRGLVGFVMAKGSWWELTAGQMEQAKEFGVKGDPQNLTSCF